MKAGFPDAPTAGRNGNYPLYGRIGAHALVQATPTATRPSRRRARRRAGEGRARSRFRSRWHAELARLAHVRFTPSSDELEAWITGVRGIAATRIAYVQGVRGGKLYVIDSDGAFPTPAGDDAGALSPSWHPKGTHLAYSVVGSTRLLPDLRLRFRGRHARQIAAVGAGLNSTPVFAPDGG